MVVFLRVGILERYTAKRNEKAPKKRRGPFMITEVHQEGRFYRLSEPEFGTGIWNRTFGIGV